MADATYQPKVYKKSNGDELVIAAGGTLTLEVSSTLGHSAQEAFAAGMTITTTDLTITDVNIVLSATTGTKIGTATTQKLGFFNATPVIQPVGAGQAAVIATGATNSSPYGFATAAQADAIVTLVNKIRTDLLALGLIKGAA